ncbi:MAG TPA: tetratricopeptide repeat protein [Verrucomicrobiae bacterium]|nr:tetratricopeptide repeat protein [Verrucomicrobiae bacterium]
MKHRFPLAGFCIVVLSCSAVYLPAQTYEVHGGSSQKAAESSPDSSEGNHELSWGSSIEVDREARAAQDALRRNDYDAAVSFAQQAAKSAPQNAEFWFLLGYAARLDQHYQLSADAYDRGLKREPNSVRGLAGLAQTYAKMGRYRESEKLLQKVTAANPRDANSLELAGELLLSSDPQSALDFLQKAEALQPSAHTDLLLSHDYQRLGQPQDSERYLDEARRRAPHDTEVLRAAADQYRDQGDFDKALSTLRDIPNKTLDVEADLAYTDQLAGKHHEAAELYSRLAKNAKSDISLDLSAAQEWIDVGKPDAAVPFLAAARQIDANNYRLHAILAGLAESQDRISEAREQYQIALNNLPAQVPEGPLYPVELHLNLYELDIRRADDGAANQELASAQAALARAHVPDDSRPEFLRLRAAIESASGNLEAANRDLKEALALAPSNLNSLTNYGNLLWKMGQKDAARATFTKVLELDRHDRQALSSLGYLARDAGNPRLAEAYFTRAIAAHPEDYAPYLALGDLYTAQHNYRTAESDYEDAYQRMPDDPRIIAGGANAAIEARNLDLAQRWLARAKGQIQTNPQVERERERYLTFRGDYAASAKLGYDVIQKLPDDHEGVVYLAYDLYYLGRYDDALALTVKYRPRLPKDKDLPFIAGNVDYHDGQWKKAFADFSEAVERDPAMAAGFVNRGFVLNDLHQPHKAVEDFQTALHLEPENGEAHLGLAYADLQLHRPMPALSELELAQKKLGKGHAWHLARAEGFRQERDFSRAGAEYRIALSEEPNDLTTQMAYAGVLYEARSYPDAAVVLNSAARLAPSDPDVYSLRARVHAKLGQRQEMWSDIRVAEQFGGQDVKVLMATGDALLTIGDRDAAMQRFSRALDIPGGDRLGVRLAIAEIFLRQGQYDDARRQIVIGSAEARLMPGSPVTAADIAESANIFLAMHDFDLAETYFDKAKLAGADNRTIALGLTNTYLAEGNTSQAASALASLGPASNFRDDYDYMMASASLQNQRQDPLRALDDFAQASSAGGQQDHGVAESEEYTAAEQEGRPLNQTLSVVPEASFAPSLEDINVYTLDAKILGVTSPSLLPPPRHSFQSMADSRYRVHVGGLPAISGFVGQSLTVGRLLFPSVGVVEDRNTYDTILNGGVTPAFHIGSNAINLNAGLQFTLRRDTISPAYMSQNLFKQFLYVSTSAFGNWLTVNGSATRETGPFIDQDLHSRDAAANIEFTVGRPWGKTSLITGYSVRDLLFRPFVEEYFNTTTYIGLQRKFGSRLTAALLAEDLRSWRVETTQYATAQALLPGARFDIHASPRWSVEGSFVLSRGEGYHAYDNTQSQLLVSYVRPLRSTLNDGGGEVPVSYPMRFSFGIEQQTFYDFPGSSRTTLLPVVHFSIF